MFNATAYITGFFCFFISLFMLVPMLVDAVAGNPDWHSFFIAALIVSFLSLTLIAATYRSTLPAFSARLGFILVNALWLATSAAAALPFMLSNSRISVTDAVFEAVSGLTTTGATVFSGLDVMPPGLLLWRSMTQWIGGIGVIAMGFLLLPFLRVGGMQVYRLESSAQSDNPFPRFAQLSTGLILLYVGLSVACAAGYRWAGMSDFDAINHAMTTLSTGGFSTHDASMGFFGPGVLVVGSIFMLAGSMPFIAMLRAVLTGNPRYLLDPQVPVLLGLFVAGALAVAAFAEATLDWPPLTILNHSIFNVISIMSTTGYASTDYTLWGPAVIAVVMLITFLGGAAGSTAGGVKTFRLMVLFSTIHTAIRELVYPDGVFAIRLGGQNIPPGTIRSVAIFVFAFFTILLLLTVCLAATGLDLVTSFTGALTALTNVGPGLGDTIGPAGNFASLSDIAKWLLVAGMLLGRLEIMSVLVVLTPFFWREH